MPAPYDYSLNATRQGSVGPVDTAINMGFALKKQKLLEAQQAVKLQKQQELDTYLQGVVANPTSANIDRAILKYPHLAKSYKDVADRAAQNETDTDKNERLGRSQRVYAALDADRPEIATKYLEDVAAAYEGSGRTQDAQQLRDQVKFIKENPKLAKTTVGFKLRSLMEPGEFQKAFMAEADLAGTEASTSQTVKETELMERGVKANEAQVKTLVDRLNLDKDKHTFNKNKEMGAQRHFEKNATPEAQKFHTQAASKLEATAGTLSAVEDLQKRIPDLEGKVGGVWSTVENKVLDYINGIDDPQRAVIVNQLNEVRIRNALSMKAAGAMSDPEAAMYLSTQLPAGAKPEAITEYLGAIYGQAKKTYDYNRLKVGFLRKNLDSSIANKTFKPFPDVPTINKGELFDDYVRRTRKELADEQTPPAPIGGAVGPATNAEVVLPNGKIMRFQSEEAAQQFRAKAGL